MFRRLSRVGIGLFGRPKADLAAKMLLSGGEWSRKAMCVLYSPACAFAARWISSSALPGPPVPMTRKRLPNMLL